MVRVDGGPRKLATDRTDAAQVQNQQRRPEEAGVWIAEIS